MMKKLDENVSDEEIIEAAKIVEGDTDPIMRGAAVYLLRLATKQRGKKQVVQIAAEATGN